MTGKVNKMKLHSYKCGVINGFTYRGETASVAADHINSTAVKFNPNIPLGALSHPFMYLLIFEAHTNSMRAASGKFYCFC